MQTRLLSEGLRAPASLIAGGPARKGGLIRSARPGTGHRSHRWIVPARGLGAALALALAVLPAGTGPAAASPGRPAATAGSATSAGAQQKDTTASGNDLRTGWDRNEPGLSPATVASSQFGQVFSTAVNGQVYAQPLVIGSTVVVATETTGSTG